MWLKEPFQSTTPLPLRLDVVTPDELGRELELELELVELEPFEPSEPSVLESSELLESEFELSGRPSSLLSPSSPLGVLVGSGVVEVEVGLRIVEVEVIV